MWCTWSCEIMREKYSEAIHFVWMVWVVNQHELATPASPEFIGFNPVIFHDYAVQEAHPQYHKLRKPCRSVGNEINALKEQYPTINSYVRWIFEDLFCKMQQVIF